MEDLKTLNNMDYSAVGDIAAMSLCMCCCVFLLLSYLRGSGKIKSMIGMIITIFMSSSTNIICHALLSDPIGQRVPIYIFRGAHNLCILLTLILYIGYLGEPLWLGEEVRDRHMKQALILAPTAVAIDFVLSLLKVGYYIDSEGVVHKNASRNIYMFMIILLVVTIIYILLKNRDRIIKQVFRGLAASNIMALVMMSVQGFHRQVSFTSLAFFFPVLGLMFFFHSNPYDVETGAVSDSYIYPVLDKAIEKDRSLYLICCYIKNFTTEFERSKDIHVEFNRFFREKGVRGVLYRFPHDRLILAFSGSRKTGAEKLSLQMIDSFKRSYSRFKLDFKLTVCKTTPDFADGRQMLDFIEFLSSSQEMNTIHYATPEDIAEFHAKTGILSELKDIAERGDLDDERVLVYCQPVYSLLTGKYDTAEALMRLRGEDGEMIFPDKFIPVAEHFGFIHPLSMIILNKTCKQVHKLLEAGYHLQRISVNFSPIDLRCETFCDEVCRIIQQNDIPFGKIAVEITESRSESDFSLMKQKVTDLQRRGIKFYLDDFGTGYSNFERIMEIPFDIIKFDRSMLIESGKSESSEFMVCTFANMFNQLDYSVLFEGVETDSDETHCMKMSASYLQGYKYSRPIPIEQLSHFLTYDDKVHETIMSAQE